jgi:hypothetical protein
VLEYLAPHISRTRSLVIQAYHDIHTAYLHLCNPAPLLQHLDIVACGSIAHLPDNFLGQQTPSLRSVKFSGICPKLETLFPLPNLTEFCLSLPDGMGSFRTGALFLFFSHSPLLQKISISIHGQTVQDISLDQVISLESLVELNYVCKSFGRILPFLELPRLKRFRVSLSLGPGQVQTLADVLPHDGRVLLAGATRMSYHCNRSTHRFELSGSGVVVSFSASCTAGGPAIIDLLFDRTCIPLEQIEDLTFGGGPPIVAGFPINVFALENLRVLHVLLWGGEFTKGLLCSLHPDPGAGVPCRSLQEIKIGRSYWGPQDPLSRLFMSLVRERKRAGHQLRCICLAVTQGSDLDFVEELGEHVGEVRTQVLERRV